MGMSKWNLQPARDLALKPAERRRSLRRESDLVETGCHLLWGLTVRLYLQTWHRLEVTGREYLPTKPPFVLVANHTSHLDALVLAAPLPLTIRDQLFSVAAGDVFFEKNWTAVFATTLLNALPIWRRKTTAKALAELRRRLIEEPCAYILFPEGSRSRERKMTRFKPGIGMMLAGTPVPVVPCYLEGSWAALPPGCSIPRPTKIRLRAGPPLHFADVANERAGWDAVAQRLEEAVTLLGEPATRTA